MTKEKAKQIFMDIQKERGSINLHMPIEITLGNGSQWLHDIMVPQYSVAEIKEMLQFIGFGDLDDEN